MPAVGQGVERRRFGLPLLPLAVVVASIPYGWWLFRPLVETGDRYFGLALLLTVWAYFVAGAVAWWRRPDNIIGKLMVLHGFTLTIAVWGLLPNTFLISAWTFLAVVSYAVLGHLLLAFPEGALQSRFDRVYVTIGYLGNLVSGTIYAIGTVPYCEGCVAAHNIFLIGEGYSEGTFLRITAWEFYLAGLPLTLILVVRLIMRLSRATPVARRVMLPVYVPAMLALLIGFGTRLIAQIAEGLVLSAEATLTMNRVAATAFGVMPVTFLLGLLRTRARRGRAADLAIRLDGAPSLEGLRDSVGRALRDPSADVAFWNPETQDYVTADGELVDAEDLGQGRAVSVVTRGDQPLGLLVYDAALREDPVLVSTVTAVARLEIENHLLRAERSQEIPAPAGAGDPRAVLSDREREVLALMADGLSNAAICERLHLSPRTVESHIAAIFTRLDLPVEAATHRRVLAVLSLLRNGGGAAGPPGRR